jgi:DNA-directed RNA polymerase subunit RPC12/RpoP
MNTVGAMVTEREQPSHDHTESRAASADRCPVCRDKVVVKSPREILIRNAILRVDALTGRVTAKCGRCKSWVEVPLRYVG